MLKEDVMLNVEKELKELSDYHDNDNTCSYSFRKVITTENEMITKVCFEVVLKPLSESSKDKRE